MDIDAVDFGRIGLGDGPRDGGRYDPVVEPLALGRLNRFRIAHSGNVPVGMQHDGRRDDRTRQTAAAHFVDAGHMHEPDAAQRVLERAHRRDSRHTSLAGRAGRVGLAGRLSIAFVPARPA